VKATGCERGRMQIFEIDQLIFIKTACQNTHLVGRSSAVLTCYVFDSKTSCRPHFQIQFAWTCGGFFLHIFAMQIIKMLFVSR
jgi:hypothetical protein